MRRKMCYAGCVCMDCEAQRKQDHIYYKQRRKSSKEFRSAKQQQAARYGITVDEILAMESEQRNLCAICKKPETSRGNNQMVKSLSVDHCHETGKVRGLLCNNCNRAIGLLGDDVDTLLNAIEYLRNGGVKH